MRSAQKTIDVDWKYVPGKDMPSSSAPGLHCYCSAYIEKTLYFSDNFDVYQGTPINLIRDDFVRFVKGKYYSQSSIPGSGGCGIGNDMAKERKNMSGVYKVIDTGWRPTSLPPQVRH